jgi:hypothetical protein
MPKRMLRHKAFKECARLAFGFAGVYDEDEARDIEGAVEQLQKPIDAGNATEALDVFAAEVHNVLEQEAGAKSPPQHASAGALPTSGLGSDQVAPNNPPSDSVAATLAPFRKSEAIGTLLTIAAETDNSEEDRMADINKQWPRYKNQFEESEPDFLAQLFSTAEKVARGDLKVEAARKYLEGL